MSGCVRRIVLSLGCMCIGFGTRLCGQIVGVPVGADCAPLSAGLFLYCYEGDFVDSLDRQADVVGAFGSNSGCLGGTGSPCFGGVICPPGLQLNEAHATYTESHSLDSHISVAYGFDSPEFWVFIFHEIVYLNKLKRKLRSFIIIIIVIYIFFFITKQNKIP